MRSGQRDPMFFSAEESMGEEGGWEEATDCQIAAWQSSVPSGTVTTSATAASVVVAVRWRQDGEKQRKTREGGAMRSICNLLPNVTFSFFFCRWFVLYASRSFGVC